MQYTREIQQAEIEVRRMRREFERYFAGALDLPPHELQTKVERKIKQLQSAVRSSADQFRVNALEASFATYRELYGRRIRKVEEGRDRRVSGRTDGPEMPDPRDGVVVEGQVSEKAAMSLYRDLYGRKEAPAVGLDQFKKYLDQQAEKVRSRSGCDRIMFRLADEEGTPRLKARPIRTD